MCDTAQIRAFTVRVPNAVIDCGTLEFPIEVAQLHGVRTCDAIDARCVINPSQEPSAFHTRHEF